jgi:hypothetical protein
LTRGESDVFPFVVPAQNDPTRLARLQGGELLRGQLYHPEKRKKKNL